MKQNYWLSISDMMSGLMLIFLFISVSYMVYANNQKDKVKRIAIAYQELRHDIYKELYDAFKYDLINWNAELDSQKLAVRFKAPEVLFVQGSDELNERFRNILREFFPKFIGILVKSKYMQNIEEVRVEGHTSSEWKQSFSADEVYLKNMELSQDRTRSVLSYILLLENLIDKKDWLKKHLTANGLSSSKLILVDGKEDPDKSRRVEFRIRTDAERQIQKILNE